jgi:hypothetical protein
LDKFTKENGKWINLVEYLAPKMNNYLESNKNGQTPLDIARSQGNTRMLKGFDAIPHTKRFH